MKSVKTKKYFHFHNARNPSLWATLPPPCSYQSLFHMMGSLSPVQQFWPRRQSPFPLSSCPLSCCLPQSPFQRPLQIPKHPAFQSPLIPFTLSHHLIFWRCLDIYDLFLFFQPSGVKFYPSHHPSMITRKLEKRVCFQLTVT